MEELLEFGMFFSLYYLVIWGIGIAMYVLQAVGLYTIAKRRGIEHAWLAWLPVGNVWLLGAIADHYRRVARGEKHNRRTAMLILAIVVIVMTIVAVVLMIGSLVDLALQADGNMYFDDDVIIAQFLSVYFSSIGLMLLAGAVSIAQVVLQFICLYELFASCEPENKVLYLLLSILFNLSAIFVFVCRKKDLGMQPQPMGFIPRYQPPVYQQPVYQPPVYQPPVYQPPVPPAPPAEPAAEASDDTAL